MTKLIALVFGATVLLSTAAYADPGQNANNGGGHDYVLLDGTTVYDNPGEMFQYLRTRDNGLANGNPKDIVEAYPDSFENVGDLIAQKRVDEE